jgi:Icc-related predicted phosphoesterase
VKRNLIIIGDPHAHFERLAEALRLVENVRPRLALLAGDIGEDPPWEPAARLRERSAHDESVRRVIRTVAAALDCPVIFVPGNHDLESAPHDCGGVNCDGEPVEQAGLRVAGLGGAGPDRFGFAYEWGERQAEDRLRRFDGETDGAIDVLLCHAPPAASELDRIHDGRHVGSAAVRRAIGRLRPRLFVCGHIHEAWGVQRIDGVFCINAGALGEPYGQPIVWNVEWGECGPTRIESLRRAANAEVARRSWGSSAEGGP